MEKREKYKIVELKGRKWQISKFDAQTGSYIAYKLFTQMIGSGFDDKVAEHMPMPLPQNRPVMSKAEFMELQRDCLSVVSEIQTVGGVEAPQPIFLVSGAWAVGGLEDDTMLVIMLTIHSLIFNVGSFFDASALKELTASISGMSLFGAKT